MTTASNHITVNAIPFGKLVPDGVQTLMQRWQYLCKKRTWNGMRQNLKLNFQSDIITVSGGRFKLKEHVIHIVSETMTDEKIRNSDELLTEWLANYKLIFLLCDAEELLTLPGIQHEMAFYRMAMRCRGRYFDCFLFLTAADKLIDIEYTGNYFTTYLGICTAFTPKGFNKTRLTSKYKDMWQTLSWNFLGQIHREVQTKMWKKRFSIPANLLCDNPLYQDAGYIEALYQCINSAFDTDSIRIKKISNHNIYNNMAFEFFQKLFSNRGAQNTIRLAVIGQTSSGKTYLLTDLCQAILRLGYTEKNDPNSKFRYIGNFLNDVCDPTSGIDGTPVYICRQNNHYQTNFESETGDRFSLEFIDIPGEVISRNSIEEFIGIIIALNQCRTKYFKVETWSTEDGGKVAKIVKYDYPVSDQPVLSKHNDQDEKKDENQENLPNLDENQPAKSRSLINDINGKRDKVYLSTDEVIEDCRRKRMICRNTNSISGEDLLNNFYDYIPDTVVNAIAEAWDILDIHVKLKKGDIEDGISQNDSDKDRFEKKYKNQFYFLYYCLTATDIVLCDKMAVPTETNMTDKAKDNFNQMITALRVFKGLLESLDIGRAKNKNWYLAFRGADSLIYQENFKNFMTDMEKHDEDATYSLYAILQALYLKEQNNPSQGNKNRIKIIRRPSKFSILPPYIEDSDSFREMITSLSTTDVIEIINDYYPFVKNKEYECFLKESTKYHVAGDRTINEYINERLSSFSSIVGECLDTSIYPFLGIPPHVFFTATPIDKFFDIFSHDPDNPRRFEGPVSHPSGRYCFGTQQLLKDILLANSIKLPDGKSHYGLLLSYFFGGN